MKSAFAMLVAIIGLVWVSTTAQAAGPDIVLADFEGPDYGDWKFLHLHGDADKVVPLEKNSLVIRDRYRALGGAMELIVVPGKGYENAAAFFESQPMLDFLLRQGLGASAGKSP